MLYAVPILIALSVMAVPILIALSVMFGILIGRQTQKVQVEQLKRERDLNVFKGVCWHRHGEDHIYGPFHIISIDDCQTWHILKESGEIIGLADMKWPGLIDRLEGVRELADYLSQEGENAFLTERGKELIKKVGLTIPPGKNVRRKL